MTIKTAPETVFGVLADARSYERWLVGCKKIRAVDEGWPAPQTRFYHRVGLAGPLTLEDNTTSLESEPPHRLVMEARARPVGTACVEFLIEDDGAGGSAVTVVEKPVRGPAATLHNPLSEALIAARNKKSLKQLREYCESLSANARTTPATGAAD